MSHSKNIKLVNALMSISYKPLTVIVENSTDNYIPESSQDYHVEK